MTPPELTADERLILLYLVQAALGDLAFAECPDGHPRVRERLTLCEVLLRGDHRPKPRRHRRTRALAQKAVSE
jgi:hypothetical protein